MQLIIDVVGGCNLKCPSCPIGNMAKSEGGVLGGVMKVDVFEQVINKAIRELDKVDFVALYNWTEPLLHPKLPELITIVKSKGIPVHLSSNLNILKKPDEIMLANPDYFRVSVSGFNQENYGVTHKGGDIENVKKNMLTLMESKLRTKATTYLTVLFHKYIDNEDEEEEMRVFAESLGYHFEAVWAYLMPLEKVMAYAGVENPGTTLNEQDWETIDRLALPLSESILGARSNPEKPCWLINNQLVLNPKGDVVLCCSVFDQEKNALGNYLDMTPEELGFIQQNNRSIETCSKCMSSGLHNLAVYDVEGLDELTNKNRQILSK